MWLRRSGRGRVLERADVSFVKGMFAPKNVERVCQVRYDGHRYYYLRFGDAVNIGFNCVKPVRIFTVRKP